MRISDWSSDVCSSDLLDGDGHVPLASVGGAEDRPRARIRIFLTSELFTLKVACGDDPRNGQLTVDQILLDMQRLIETHIAGLEIGSASFRARVCQYVYISFVSVSLKTKTLPIYFL